MSRGVHEIERVQGRVLGALRCVDVNTRVDIGARIELEIAQAQVMRNRSGLHVITRAAGLEDHEAAFDDDALAAASPGLGSMTLAATLRDPSGHYLPRLATIALPRDPAPAHAGQADSLFRPIEIALHPSGTAPTGVNWCVLRVHVGHIGSGDALGGALLLVRSGGSTLARGLTDWRGEALVCVPGVPRTTWSTTPGSVVVSEIAAQLIAVHDPDAGLRTAAAQVREGRPPAALPRVDPDRLEARRTTLPHATRNVQLAAGATRVLSISLALP